MAKQAAASACFWAAVGLCGPFRSRAYSALAAAAAAAAGSSCASPPAGGGPPDAAAGAAASPSAGGALPWRSQHPQPMQEVRRFQHEGGLVALASSATLRSTVRGSRGALSDSSPPRFLTSGAAPSSSASCLASLGVRLRLLQQRLITHAPSASRKKRPATATRAMPQSGTSGGAAGGGASGDGGGAGGSGGSGGGGAGGEGGIGGSGGGGGGGVGGDGDEACGGGGGLGGAGKGESRSVLVDDTANPRPPQAMRGQNFRSCNDGANVGHVSREAGLRVLDKGGSGVVELLREKKVAAERLSSSRNS